jgi:hypothetical protein
MTLPWVRLDANIASHDKTLELISRKDGYRAFTVYICGLGYAGGHGTDGFIPRLALPLIHGTTRHGEMLVDVVLWRPEPNGWSIHNWADRQELEFVAAGKREMKRMASAKGNCSRWHGPTCWRQGKGCSREIDPVAIRLGVADANPA